MPDPGTPRHATPVPAGPDADLVGRGGTSFAELVATLRAVQDRVSGTDAPPDVLVAATQVLREAARLLAEYPAADGEQHAGSRVDLPGRGHPLLPAFVADVANGDLVEGRVTLTRTHLSGAGRVHAGAIGLLFGEVLGTLSVARDHQPSSRNAALHVDYRAPTPIEVELKLTAQVTGREGRKVHVAGQLRHGDTLLVEGHGLYVRMPAD